MGIERFRVVEGLFVRTLGDEKVVYSAGGEKVLFLNATAALVFDLCDGTRDRAAIARELLARYDAGEEQVFGDVATALRLMAENGVVRDAGG